MQKKQFKTGVNIIGGFQIDDLTQLELIKRAGFDAFFSGWESGSDLSPLADKAEKLGLICQSVHAPFGGVDRVWKEGVAGDDYIDMLSACLDECKKVGAPIMIAHPFIGFFDHSPNALGVSRFLRLIDHASKLGVKIAFENVEGEEYLAAIMEASDPEYAGFCLDTGHEVCYNRSRDRLALYGERLIATHFNDNLGIRTTDGSITPADDLHLLPFDGVVDWKGVMERIHKYGYDGIITFELKVKGGAEHEKYRDLTPEEYFETAHERAMKVINL